MNNCIICKKELELVENNEYQPYGGGEVNFIFSFGSAKFDKSPGTTKYFGYICDECAESFVNQMEERMTDFNGEPFTSGYTLGDDNVFKDLGFDDEESEELAQETVDKILEKAKLGYCPKCGEPGKTRERRPNGNDKCVKGHVYPSNKSVFHKMKPR